VSSHRNESGRPRSWDLGSTGVRALAVVAVVVAVVAAVIAWRSRPALEPLARPSADADVTGSASGSADMLVVAVSGLVRRPGLVRLPAGSRVADAIDGAGGALPGTDLSMTNLARKVADGELIVVGVAPSAMPAASMGGGPGGSGGGLVNLNTATLEQLQTLPGVGPVLAQRIIDYREQNGHFRSVADLRKVTGIGDARYNELKARVTV
jgi:competence protein ComEA